MLTNEQMIVRSGAIRDQVLAFIDEHERGKHDGEPCPGNRCSFLAYLAHCLGLHSPAAWAYVMSLSEQYRRECRDCDHRPLEEL